MKKKHSRENLRIAMLGHKRIPSREGGIEIVVEELATRMAKKSHSVTCYNRKGHNVAGSEFDGTKLKTYKGVTLQEVFTIDKRGLAAMTASVSASLRAALGNYDVVHIHAEGPAFMCWLPKLFGKKVIVTVHGLDHQRAKWGKFASWYIRSGEKNAVRFADEIIVLSKGVQDYFQNTYGRTTRFIPNGVNKAKPRKARQITEKWGLTKDSYILYLGRIVPEKGERYLIEAFKQTKTDKKLVIAGGSSDTQAFMDELKSLAKDDDRIIFTGFVQGEILEELYSNPYIYTLPSDLEGIWQEKMEQKFLSGIYQMSDFFVLPTEYEIFGMVLLEAMYYKTVVLTTQNGGSSTVMCNGKNGYVLQTKDPRQWANVITDTYKDKGKMKMIQNNAHEVIEKNIHGIWYLSDS